MRLRRLAFLAAGVVVTVATVSAPASAAGFFIDDDDSIFENDINAIAAAGITKGCNPPTNNRYCPTQTVSRGAMAAFLRRALLSGSVLPKLGADPGSLAFGDVAGSKALIVSLMHPGPSGTFPIVVDRTEITGPGASSFDDLFDDSADVTILPNDSLLVAVLFTPGSVGPQSATLSVFHSGASSPLTVPLTGAGIAVQLTADPSTLEFGETQVDDFAVLGVTVTNTAPPGSPSIPAADVSLRRGRTSPSRFGSIPSAPPGRRAPTS